MRAWQKAGSRSLALLGLLLVTSGSTPLNEISLVHEKQPAAMILTVTPGSVAGGKIVTATITLDAPAPSGGTAITLQSQSPEIAAVARADNTGTARVDVRAGQTTASARVHTFGRLAAATVTLIATAGDATATATLSVSPPSISTLTLTPASVTGGATTTAMIHLDGSAPSSTVLEVQLSSSLGAVSVPAAVNVPAGQNSVSFTASTLSVASSTSATISAAFQGSSRSATVNVLPLTLALSALQINPASVAGSQPATGTVVLSGIASSRPPNVSLTSSSAEVSVPATLLLNPGSDRATFPISTQAVTSTRTVTITARLGSSNSGRGTGAITDGTSNTIQVGESAPVSGSLTLQPLVLVSGSTVQAIAVQPGQVVGGSPVSITVTMAAAAPAGATVPLTVGLSTNQPQLLLIPTRVSIPAGSTTGTVTATTTAPNSDQTVTITAGNSQAVSTTLLIKAPPPITSFALRPATIKGGLNVIAQFTLASGFTAPVEVKLTTDHPELIKVPAAVTLSSAAPLVLTLPTSATRTPTTVTIKATAGAQTVSTSVILTP